MKKLIGILLILGGVGLGFYVGGYVLFVGGIIDIIEQVKGDVLPYPIVWGLVKITCAGFIGTIVGLILFIPGYRILEQ